jgi:sigma-B regulation protein RsbU (phosphoserine phosphatase)
VEPGEVTRSAVVARRALGVAIVFVAALLVVDFVDEPTTLVGGLVLGPFLAGAFAGPRAAAAVGGFAVLGALGTLFGSEELNYDTFVRLGVLLAGVVLSVFIATRRYSIETALREFRELAESAQLSILRPIPETVGHLHAGARYLAAVSEATMGGDFYDLIETPFGLRAVVGDVRGKGRVAVRLASGLLNRFRQAAEREPDLAAVVATMEAAMVRHGGAEDFATALVMQFTPGKVELLSCGHPAPFLLDGEGARPIELEPALPLGLGSEPVAATIPFEQGRLLVYTDGLIEARSKSGQFFSIQRHVPRLVSRPLGPALDELLAILRRHTGGRLQDDVAVLLVEPVREGDGHVAQARWRRLAQLRSH